MTQPISVRIPLADVATLDRVALRLGLRRADVLRWAVDALVESQREQTEGVKHAE